jgi:hypothetical protein
VGELQQRPFETALRPSHGARIAWVVVGLLVLGGAAVLLWRWNQSRMAPPVVTSVPESKPAAPEAAPALPMAQGDALVKDAAGGLSSSSELAKWLAEPDILRRVVASVSLIAEGSSPRSLLGFLTPADRFQVVREGETLRASPKNRGRYESATKVLTSIDPGAAAQTYARLKPYVDSAFAQIGRPGQSFDGVLRQAIGNITSVPVPEREPELEEKGLVYAYKDPKLEGLSAAQKHLLRMGVNSARSVQGWLKKLDEAIPKPAP